MRLSFLLGALAGSALAMPTAPTDPDAAVPAAQTGRGTVYLQNGATGSCGRANPDSAVIAAIGNFWMQNRSPGPDCGRTIRVTNTGSNDGVGGQGNTVNVLVQDTCPSCGQGDVDLSVGAWNQLTNGAPFGTFNAQWDFV